MMRALALDYGDKRIGVAISDEMGWTAQGVSYIKRTTLAQDLTVIENVISEYGNVGTIVIGMPFNMDGSEGERVLKTREFAKELEQRFQLPVVEIDERWSSMEAEKILINADMSRQKRKGKVDQLAATLILQTYLGQTNR